MPKFEDLKMGISELKELCDGPFSWGVPESWIGRPMRPCTVGALLDGGVKRQALVGFWLSKIGLEDYIDVCTARDQGMCS